MRTLLAAFAVALGGCAAVAPAPAPDVLFRLPPSSLGHELALQQRMTVSAQGRSRQLAVAIESDSASVRVAVMDFGQTVLRLDWDGQALQESRAPGWPASISPERVLSDLQLVHWPVDAIRSVLPAGWSVDSDGGTRSLRAHGRVVIRIQRPARDTAELEHLAAGYRVLLQPWQEGAP